MNSQAHNSLFKRKLGRGQAFEKGGLKIAAQPSLLYVGFNL